MYVNQIIECFEAFKPFVFLPSDIYFVYETVVINEREEVSFYHKSYRYNWLNKVCEDELMYFFCSILRCAIIILDCFCSLVTIVYTFIFNVVDDVA